MLGIKTGQRPKLLFISKQEESGVLKGNLGGKNEEERKTSQHGVGNVRMLPGLAALVTKFLVVE